MSALGQKQTFAGQDSMSSLPPEADIRNRGTLYLNSGASTLVAATPAKKVRRGVSYLTLRRGRANLLLPIRIVMCAITGSDKCHTNSIAAALSKLSCSPDWRCFWY